MDLSKFIDSERLIHSIKTAIACVLGIALTKWIGFSTGQWVVLTIIVLMCAQIYVGSVIQKSYWRFLGTLVGTVIAILALISLGTTNLSIGVTVAISSFLFSYI